MHRWHLLETESSFLEPVAFPNFCFRCLSSGMTMGTGRIMVGSPWTAGVSLPLILVRCRTCWWCNLASKRQNAGPMAGFHVSRHPGLASLPVTAALLKKTAECVALHKRSRLGREVRGCLLSATSHVRSRQDPAEHQRTVVLHQCKRRPQEDPHNSCRLWSSGPC